MRKFLWSIILWVFYKPFVTFITWRKRKTNDSSILYWWSDALTEEADFLLKLKDTDVVRNYLWDISWNLFDEAVTKDADEIRKRYNYETDDINEFLFIDLDEFYSQREGA